MSLLYTTPQLPAKGKYHCDIFLYCKIQTFGVCLIIFHLVRLARNMAKRFFYCISVMVGTFLILGGVMERQKKHAMKKVKKL